MPTQDKRVQQTVWGVDSAAAVNTRLLECVIENYGKPRFWGRYLATTQGVADGLTTQEVALLHQNGIKILPIYNLFRSAINYNRGQSAAKHAVSLANQLGIPKGVYLFANMEKYFVINAGWIRGWFDTIHESDYRPGFYGNPVVGSFGVAFCTAVLNDPRLKSQVVLWSSHPRVTATKAANPPAFRPAKPPCPANVWGWQYVENTPRCTIDQNLIDSRLLKSLW